MNSTSATKIDWCSYEAAKFAVLNWHYSKRMPKSKIARIGVWEDGNFRGVVIFGVGATREMFSPYGLKPTEGCELTRIALSKHKTPVSRIVKVAIAMIKKQYPKLKLIVSFADPEQGHAGKIYQAGNWIYAGKSPKCKFPIIDGRVAHPRMLSLRVKAGKIRRDQVKYVMREGKFRYLMPLTDEMRKRVGHLSKPYPKNASVE